MKKLAQSVFVLLLFISSGAMAQDSTYKELVGTYKFPAGTIIPEAIVTIDNGVLNMNSAQGASALERVKGDSFNIVSFSGFALFKRDDAKKITGVHIEASGYIFDGVKDGAAINFTIGKMMNQSFIAAGAPEVCADGSYRYTTPDNAANRRTAPVIINQ